MAKPTKEIFDDVINAVAIVYRLNPRELISDCRKRIHSEARQMAIYVLHRDFNLQDITIGGLITRNRATVRNEIKSFSGSIEVMKDLQCKYITIKDILNL